MGDIEAGGSSSCQREEGDGEGDGGLEWTRKDLMLPPSL